MKNGSFAKGKLERNMLLVAIYTTTLAYCPTRKSLKDDLAGLYAPLWDLG